MNQKTEIIERLLDLSENDLLFLIGEQLDDGLFAIPKSKASLIDSAKNWLREKHTELQQCICTNEVVRKYTGNPEDIVLISTIADAIASICIGISPFTVAVLLIKKGLSELCGDIGP